MNNYSLFKVKGGGMLPSFFTILLLLCITIVSAQTAPISGTIVDAQGSLPGVNVQIKNSSIAAITDANGFFEIVAVPEDILVITSIGYHSKEIVIGTQTNIILTLIEDETSLQEVTINAGYYKVKDKERTGSIAKISSQEIEKQPVSNPIAAMQGRMSGVNISQTTGTPGGGFNIQIRGLNSLRSQGNDPLYIVDGIPYTSQSLGSGSLTNGVMPTLPSPLNSINPNDIESIEVLKDADATAIYGSRGANGVVLISTKKGKAGATKFSVLSANTVGTAVSNLKLLNTQQYLSTRREAFANDGITQYPSDAYDVNGIWSQSRDTDWKKELIGGTSFVQNLQVSASGGSQSTQFLVSGTYRNESTVTIDDGLYKKGILHSSITHKTADDKFSIIFSSDYAADKNTLPGIDLSRFAYTIAPNAPSLYDSNETLNWENGTFDNPLANIEGVYLAQTHNLISNVMLSYKLLKSFEIKASAGFSDTNFTEYRTLPSTMYNPAWHATSNDSQVFNNTAARRSWIFEPQLNWIGKMGTSEVNVLLGTTFQSQKQKLQSVYAMGFPSDALIHSLTAANMVMLLNDETSQYKYNAFFGRVNLDFYKKYILNITGRRDGSSRFGSEHRFANFGALGAAWIFSKESFLEDNSEVVSFGKLRASYGITGNDQIGDYQYLDTYSVTPNIYDGVIGLQPTQLFNPDFGWETNKKLEAALELGFWKDRIYLSTAYFQNRSSNQLVGVPLPGTTGFPSVQANLNATVQNIGVEVELRVVAFEKKDFKWTSSFNYTSTKNKLLEYPGLDGSVYANTFVIGEYPPVQPHLF